MSTTERPSAEPAEQAIPPEAIPEALKQYAQWVCWRRVERGPDQKPDKRPINPHTLRNAGVTWPTTWSSFAHAHAVYRTHRAQGIAGIGFVLTGGDPFVGLDLDRCLDEGGLSPWAQAILEQVPSYTEISPSGTGLRILVCSPEFTLNRRRGLLEIYSHARFLTVTGRHLTGLPYSVESVSAETLAALIPDERHRDSARQAVPVEPGVHELAPDVLWERIFSHDHFGEQHRRRFLGDISLDGGDHSLAVIRLLNCLARWTGGDAALMRAMMLQSPLANAKWTSRRGNCDWLDYQIRDALGYTRHR